MHDAALDGDVRGGDLGPFLRFELGKELVADRAVFGLGATWPFADRHRQSPYEVCPADDPDEPAVAQHRHALYTFGLQKNCDVGDRGLLDDRNDVWCHHVLDLAAMRLDIFSRKLVRRRYQIEPPGPAPFSAGF